MKRSFSILAMFGLFVLSTRRASAVTLVQEGGAETGCTQVLKEQFIQGGASFMGIVLLCLILGLAVAIERIIFLNLPTTNTKKLTQEVEDALASGGVEAAKEVCRNTKGPVASIFYQGLDRVDEGVEEAEKDENIIDLRMRLRNFLIESNLYDPNTIMPFITPI